MARSRAISAAWICFSISMRAWAASRSLSALRFANSAICFARILSICSTWAISASCSSRSICSFRLVASMAARRTDTSASASISARSFFDFAMTSASLRMPTALKALLSSSAEKGVWSKPVNETESSSRPLLAIESARLSRTSETKALRFSCSSSIVKRAATERSESTSLPSISSRSWSGLNVRLPRVCAAREMPSVLGTTET